ncbi:hypothetical protein MicloDRAFT_00002020 [Microvirga lotononidis]|uniref:General stress protein 17M-like domain-containing protein n=1 Tax=Microvirga lotononidis TaxID=864069 RepID=I4Z4S0_9HYPH|nr:hypothetical protein MicloDRAFT_00002020 [Microvirga lotononidis]
MSKTVTCLYQDQQKASAIVSRLEQAGLSRGDISFYSTPSDNLIDDLESDGVPRTDAHAYAEGVRRGGSGTVKLPEKDRPILVRGWIRRQPRRRLSRTRPGTPERGQSDDQRHRC